jgi:hypothetical protein
VRCNFGFVLHNSEEDNLSRATLSKQNFLQLSAMLAVVKFCRERFS